MTRHSKISSNAPEGPARKLRLELLSGTPGSSPTNADGERELNWSGNQSGPMPADEAPTEESSKGEALQSPFFRAIHEPRYQRQEAIRAYEQHTGRSLVIFWGPITPDIITPFADAIVDIQAESPFDLMLTSLGGDGETALRMASMCHADRSDFRVIVPDTAASAATLLALAAEKVVMSDTSAMGPIDPQIYLPARDEFFPANGILEIVNDLDERTKASPNAFVLYTSLLADIDAVALQHARSAIRRTTEFVPEILKLRQDTPTPEQIDSITMNLHNQTVHTATIGHIKAAEFGIPIEYIPFRSEQWNMLWRLHTQYVAIPSLTLRHNAIEGRRVSLIRQFPVE